MSGADQVEDRGPGRIPGLDGLRAVCVMSVMAYHFSDFVLPAGGWIGVDVFFAISGYLLTARMVCEITDEGSAKRVRFLVRRAARILPALTVMLVTCSVISAFAGPWPRGADGTLLYGRDQIIPGTLLRAVFLGNWAEIYGWYPVGVLQHLWSLGLEEQFYVLLPLFVPVLVGRRAAHLRRAAVVVAGALTTSLLLGTYLIATGTSWIWVSLATPTRGASLLAGSLAAIVAAGAVRVDASGLMRAGSSCAGAVLLLLAATARDNDQGAYAWRFAVIAPSAAILVSAVAAGTGTRVLGNRVLVGIGRRSYGWYLWHFPLSVWCTGRVDGWARVVVAGVATILVAELSYRLVEQPVLSGLRRKE